MSTLLITILIAVGAVGIFVLGLSITLIRKGHDLESDVGSNREMRKLGLECAQAQIRREEAQRLGKTTAEMLSCGTSCQECLPDDNCQEKK